jgi:serine/threonine protein phosphatase PrpC
LTAAMVDGHSVSIVHVGDSRAYCLHEGELRQVTQDHSLLAELRDSGEVSEDAVKDHPLRSVVTRSLGPEADVKLDTYTMDGRAGDVYLLCSDGLTGMLEDSEVAEVLRDAEVLDEAARRLVQAANDRGGKDNISVVLFSLGET